MQGNGFKVGAVIFFLVLTAWYLFPSVQALYYNNRLSAMTVEEEEAFRSDNYGSLSRVNEKALNLGLDLQGGIHDQFRLPIYRLVNGAGGKARGPAPPQLARRQQQVGHAQRHGGGLPTPVRRQQRVCATQRGGDRFPNNHGQVRHIHHLLLRRLAAPCRGGSPPLAGAAAHSGKA